MKRRAGAIAVLAASMIAASMVGCGKSDQCFSDYKWGMLPSKVHEIAEGKGYELSGRQLCQSRPLRVPLAMEDYYIVKSEMDKEKALLYETMIAGVAANVAFYFGTSPKTDFEGLSVIAISWKANRPTPEKYQELKDQYPGILEDKELDGPPSIVFFKSKQADSLKKKAIKAAAEEGGISETEWMLRDMERTIKNYHNQKNELDKLR